MVLDQNFVVVVQLIIGHVVVFVVEYYRNFSDWIEEVSLGPYLSAVRMAEME
jgi:hypothetical protein